jgi:hypothetical protein
MNVRTVDPAKDGVVINFRDGTSAFFAAEFLYAHRSGDGNKILPNNSGKVDYWSAPNGLTYSDFKRCHTVTPYPAKGLRRKLGRE